MAETTTYISDYEESEQSGSPSNLVSDEAIASKSKPYRFSPLKKKLGIPFFFVGLGLYRAWIEIVFVGSFMEFPTTNIVGQNAFDLTMVAVLFGCAVLSKKISPFFNKGVVFWIASFCLISSTTLMFGALIFPEISPYVAWPAVLMGGGGIALVILLWSELYGCLNSVRVGLYYSLSFIVAAVAIYISMGFDFYWLFAYTLVLPLISLICVSKGFSVLPESELPHPDNSKFSFPWKTVLLMAIYAFAFGLRETSLYSTTFGPHSAFGTVAVAVFVFLGISIRGGKFDIDLIYQLALPLTIGAFLILPSFGFLSNFFSDFCLTASYTAFAILIMLILANMSYRYGISAVWLFGLERGVRALFSFLGRQTQELTQGFELIPGEPGSFVTVLIIILVIVLTIIMFSERSISSRWGVNFLGSSTQESQNYMIKKQELANRCREIAMKFKLSHREEEVLFLLAQHKTSGIIERELFISNNTSKNHIKNIYRKLDIHSRKEMFDLLGIPE